MNKVMIFLLCATLVGCGRVTDKIDEILEIINKPSKNEIIKRLGSDNCLKEYDDYWDYESNKAFATSSDGSCGWSGSNHETIDAAKEEALKYCEENREGGTPCRVVDVNGKWS